MAAAQVKFQNDKHKHKYLAHQTQQKFTQTTLKQAQALQIGFKIAKRAATFLLIALIESL